MKNSGAAVQPCAVPNSVRFFDHGSGSRRRRSVARSRGLRDLWWGLTPHSALLHAGLQICRPSGAGWRRTLRGYKYVAPSGLVGVSGELASTGQGGGREWLLDRDAGSVKPKMAASAFAAEASVWGRSAESVTNEVEMPCPDPIRQLISAHSLWK